MCERYIVMMAVMIMTKIGRAIRDTISRGLRKSWLDFVDRNESISVGMDGGEGTGFKGSFLTGVRTPMLNSFGVERAHLDICLSPFVRRSLSLLILFS